MDDMDAEGRTKTRPIDLIDNIGNLNDVCHVKYPVAGCKKYWTVNEDAFPIEHGDVMLHVAI